MQLQFRAPNRTNPCAFIGANPFWRSKPFDAISLSLGTGSFTSLTYPLSGPVWSSTQKPHVLIRTLLGLYMFPVTIRFASSRTK